MITSTETDKLWPALFAAQAEFQKPIKNKVNPHFKNRYADLATIVDAVKDALRNHGLMLLQPTVLSAEPDGQLVWGLETRVTHVASGQWVAWVIPIPLDKLPSQQQGSAITYARRYSLELIGLVAQDDDDGEAVRENKQPQQKQEPPRFGGKPAALGGEPDPKLAEAVDLRDRISAAIKAGTLSPDAVKRIHDQHGNPVPTDPDAYLAFGVAVVEAMNGGV